MLEVGTILYSGGGFQGYFGIIVKIEGWKHDIQWNHVPYICENFTRDEILRRFKVIC